MIYRSRGWKKYPVGVVGFEETVKLSPVFVHDALF